jgi:hypothetical protein
LDTEVSRASELKNPTLYRSFWRKASKLPESFQVIDEPMGCEDLSRRYCYLRITNLITEVFRSQKFRIVSVPTTYADIEHLGNLVSAFIGLPDYEKGLQLFFSWVLKNRNNWSFNWLGMYLEDWRAHELSTTRNV